MESVFAGKGDEGVFGMEVFFADGALVVDERLAGLRAELEPRQRVHHVRRARHWSIWVQAAAPGLLPAYIGIHRISCSPCSGANIRLMFEKKLAKPG